MWPLGEGKQIFSGHSCHVELLLLRTRWTPSKQANKVVGSVCNNHGSCRLVIAVIVLTVVVAVAAVMVVVAVVAFPVVKVVVAAPVAVS